MRVIVVGAGVIGCAIACELAARGAEVRVLDARTAGAGASRASAGMLAPYIEGHSPALRRLGVRSLALYDAFIERVRAAGGRAIEYQRTGSLEVALDAAEAEQLSKGARALAAQGVEHELLNAAGVLALEPSVTPRAAAGLFTPLHGFVSVRDLMAGLIAEAEQRGVVVSTGVRVEQLAATADGVRVTGANTSLDADAAVLAAGSWSGQVTVAQTPTVPVKPIRGQLVELGCARPPAGRVIWGTGCYLVPWRDGTLLAGATSEDVGFDESSTEAGVSGLLAAAGALLPPARTARFREVRVGLRPATGDELPVIGRAASAPRICYATGHYRNGVLLAPLTAAAVAGLLLDGRGMPELALTAPSRFGL